MRHPAVAAWCAGACLLVSSAAADRAGGAEVVVSINKATQSMSVLVDGAEQHSWIVSTGLGGGPPVGTFRPGRMERKWASRKYRMAPMPHSIFFEGNYAIHGTVKISQLGRRASKGCVRLHPTNAAILFALIGRNKSDTTIVISNTTHVAAKAVPPEIEMPTVEAARTKESMPEASKIETARPVREATAREAVAAPAAVDEPPSVLIVPTTHRPAEPIAPATQSAAPSIEEEN